MKRFETAEFRIEENGIALLRSKFPYRKIAFEEITELQIKKGKVVNNAVAIFLLGVLLIASGLYLGNSYGPLNLTNNQLGLKGGKALGYFVLLFGGLIIFGGIMVYQSLKKDFVLQITAKAFCQTYPLTEIRRSNELDSFIFYLREITGNKLNVISNELITSPIRK